MASRKAASTASNLLKMMVPAGQASPSSAVGPALGQRGIKAMDFCKQFNERTSKIEPGTPLPVHLTIGPNRTFTFAVKTPPTAFLLKRAAGVEKGSSTAGHASVGQLSLKHVYAIAELKQKDPNMAHLSLKSICGAVIGSARSMGIQVVN
ncbi:mitochondrial ribosomal protein L11 [Syncephalis pseudoplumigaleata]|uniref:Large ribosomal subunit protein uL11m n=1 Tax=Syncephalis pseudoplumigaleata TaxID=1712513 RepID=A0A4V1J1W9_9FUNG|nr:mitochondrial ribosomal protein L11 [Syncephalis pseudoplumigaleata]|eukprot:RKP26519.1 mitochondrial ribosomal protein L11 [Syncephalis pseudoplumigaleata]